MTVHDPLVDCHMFVGYLAVYRVCFSLAAFFFVFMVLMIGVRSSRDPRSAIQNGSASIAVDFSGFALNFTGPGMSGTLQLRCILHSQ